jgi:hypothetical protein
VDRDTTAFNLLFAVEMRGPANLAALARAFGEVRRRHASLRTTFGEEPGRTFQVAAAPDLGSGHGVGLPLPVMDLSGLPEARRVATARHLAAVEHQRSFDLERGPLFRVSVLRLGESGEAAEHVCLVAMHHVISDGWSIGVLLRETAALYGAFVRGEPSPLPEPSLQYADFAEWQRRRLQGETLEAHLGYWRERLADLPAPLDLPTDRPRTVERGFEVRAEGLELPPELTARLEAVSRRHGATLFMTLLAAFEVLLFRATGRTELVVGAPIANRTRAEIEGLIGFFLNTLVLRVRLAPEKPFSALLEEVRKAALGAYAHQDLPLETLLRAAGVDDPRVADGLLRAMFLFQNVPTPALEAAGLELRRFSDPRLPAQRDRGRRHLQRPALRPRDRGTVAGPLPEPPGGRGRRSGAARRRASARVPGGGGRGGRGERAGRRDGSRPAARRAGAPRHRRPGR